MIATLSIEFIAFECVCKDKFPEQVTIDRMNGLPSEVTELTQKRVGQTTEGCLGFGSGKFSLLRCMRCDFWRFFNLRRARWMTIAQTESICQEIEDDPESYLAGSINERALVVVLPTRD